MTLPSGRIIKQPLIDGIFRRIRGFKGPNSSGSPRAQFILGPIPLKDHVQRLSRGDLPRDVDGNQDLAIASHDGLKLDCFHIVIPDHHRTLQSPGRASEPASRGD